MKSENKQSVEWKDIPGYEGKYLVSDDGKVYSLISHINLAQRVGTSGYMCVGLWDGEVTTAFMVHRLVGAAFLGVTDSKTAIHHKNGDKQDNRLENLEGMGRGVHQSMHVTKAHEQGKMKGAYFPKGHHYSDGHTHNRGEENGRAKLNAQVVKEILLLSGQGVTQRKLAEMFGVSKSTIHSVVNRVTWASVSLGQGA